jgi:hypothetical protein
MQGSRLLEGARRGNGAVAAALQLEVTAPGPRSILAEVVSARDPGVGACALHRLAVSSRTPRPAGFRRPRLAPDAREALAVLDGLRSSRPAFVLLRAGGAELLVARDGSGSGRRVENDLGAVSRLGLTPLVTASLAEVEEFVAGVPDALGILLRKPEIEQVVAVARAGLRLPQKSTSFEPKPLCGLVFSALDGE